MSDYQLIKDVLKNKKKLKKLKATVSDQIAQITLLFFELNQLKQKENQMIINIQALIDEVKKTQGVEASALVVFTNLREQMTQMQTTINQFVTENAAMAPLQAQIDDLVQTLDSGADDLANAISSNSSAPTGPTENVTGPTGATASDSITGPTDENTVTGPTSEEVTGPTGPTVIDTNTVTGPTETPADPAATGIG